MKPQSYWHPMSSMPAEPLPGKLIVLEGTDGVGRSTQIQMLKNWLESMGVAVYDTGLSRSVLCGRDLQRAKQGHTLDPITQALYYATDFADRLENEMLPALRAGCVVLTDRYIYSLMARAIVRGNEVDAAVGTAARVVELLRRAENARSKIGSGAGIPAPEPAHGIAELVVPLQKRMWEGTELVAPRAQIPGFGDQFYAVQDWILSDCSEKGRIGVKAVAFSGKSCGKVKAKPIHMHHLDPIAQTVHDHAQDHRVIEVQRVSAAGIVAIKAGVVG